jgi:hypothetical protein
MDQPATIQPEPYEPPLVVDLPTDGPSSVCAIVQVSQPPGR